jgi:hypothetical protein
VFEHLTDPCVASQVVAKRGGEIMIRYSARGTSLCDFRSANNRCARGDESPLMAKTRNAKKQSKKAPKKSAKQKRAAKQQKKLRK